jgi:hypothetical protein
LIDAISGRNFAMSAAFSKIEPRPALVHRRLSNSIKRVRHEHAVAFGRDALADVAHRRAQAECVGPDQHAGVRAARWVDERSIAGPIGRLDRDFVLDDRQRGRQCRPGGGHESGGYRQRDEIPA